MSTFGQRMVVGWAAIDGEFTDQFMYIPRHEVVNGEPEPDPSRVSGIVPAIILDASRTLGSGWGLQGMHSRASAKINIWYMSRGILGDPEDGTTSVRKFDRFLLADGYTAPDRRNAYEVADGPQGYGFGRWFCDMVEIPWPDDAPPLPLPTRKPVSNPLHIMTREELEYRVREQGYRILIG